MKTPPLDTRWKTLIGLMVALPMIAYVAGALIATKQEPPQYDAIVLRPAEAAPSGITVLAPAGPSSEPVTTAVQEITPSPDDLDDDSDNAGRDGRDDSDDRDEKGDRDKSDDDGRNGKDDDQDRSGPGNGGGADDDDEPDDDTDDPDDDPDDDAEPDDD